MRRIILLSVLATFSFLTPANAQQSQDPPAGAENAGRLPVKRVVLYKNGVGYFEHSTRVQGTQDLNIDFTSAQLNDALKSLTVVDRGDGRITGVRFNSVAPLSERLKTLRLPLGEEASRGDLLEALRGTRVEVHSGSAGTTGKVLGIDTRKVFGASANQMEEVTVLTLVTDAGEVRSFDLGPATTVRIAEHELAAEVDRYLNLIGSAKAVDLRRLTISAAGTGEREIFVSYISEVPVWKSTYRILLDAKHEGKPLVQGWAVVDNTIGEDWKDVQLSLVAGAPQSFVQNISQPMYVRRPEVALPASAMLTPQSHESAMNAPAPPPSGAPGALMGGGRGGGFAPGKAGLEGTVKDQSGTGVGGARVTVRNEETGESQTVTSNAQGFYSFNNIAPGNAALFVKAPGFQHFDLTNIYLGVGRVNEIQPTLSAASNSQTVEVRDQALQLERETSEISSNVERSGSEAEARTVGDFFEYDLQEKVTIGKNQSALVPILQARIDTQKVTLWNEDSSEPLRALWLNNTSGLEFDAGSFNILDEGTFSGEGMLGALRPGEKRLISYAADPAVRIKMVATPTERPFSRVQIDKGTMIMTKEERETRTYTVSNSGMTPREVIIEHPIRDEWKLAEGAKPEEKTASLYRFRVDVEPKAGAELVVVESHPISTEVELSDVSDKEVAILTEQKRMTPKLQQAIKKVLDQKGVVDRLDNQVKICGNEQAAIAGDQGRLRENMKALKGSVEERALVQRYTHQLNQQEDRLATLRGQMAELQAKSNQATDQLDKIIAEIGPDESF